MPSTQTQTMEQELRTAPARLQTVLVAFATKNYTEAARRLQRLCQLHTYVARKGLDEIEVSEEIELSLEAAVPLAALLRLWHCGPGGARRVKPTGLRTPGPRGVWAILGRPRYGKEDTNDARSDHP